MSAEAETVNGTNASVIVGGIVWQGLLAVTATLGLNIELVPNATGRDCACCLLRAGVGAGNRGLDVDELAAFMRNLDLDLSPSEAMLVGRFSRE